MEKDEGLGGYRASWADEEWPPWPGDAEDENRAFRGGRNWDERTRARFRGIEEAISEAGRERSREMPIANLVFIGEKKPDEKPDEKLIWNTFAAALGREPTHLEVNTFLRLMREHGWVDSRFHTKKVSYLQEVAKEPLGFIDGAARQVIAIEDENLALRSLLDEHRLIIEKLRAKLVEQDEVIEKLAVGNSKRKVMSC